MMICMMQWIWNIQRMTVVVVREGEREGRVFSGCVLMKKNNSKLFKLVSAHGKCNWGHIDIRHQRCIRLT